MLLQLGCCRRWHWKFYCHGSYPSLHQMIRILTIVGDALSSEFSLFIRALYKVDWLAVCLLWSRERGWTENDDRLLLLHCISCELASSTEYKMYNVCLKIKDCTTDTIVIYKLCSFVLNFIAAICRWSGYYQCVTVRYCGHTIKKKVSVQ